MAIHNYKPLTAALLVYDVLRLVVLVIMSVSFFPPESGLFPHLVYLTSNALFPLMALFIFIRLQEFKNYLPLYLAGKIFAVISFYVWGMVSFRAALGEANLEIERKYIYPLLGGNFALNLGDLLSILGSWFLLSKLNLFRHADNNPAAAGEHGGI